MSLAAAIKASASALSAERTRIEVAISNIANSESTRSTDGQPYRRRDVVLSSEPVGGFDAMLGQLSPTGVKVSQIVEDSTPFRKRYEPSHPDADKDGFVSLPNVDTPQEMVDLIGASRAYQANLAAISVVKETVSKALELGR